MCAHECAVGEFLETSMALHLFPLAVVALTSWGWYFAIVAKSPESQTTVYTGVWSASIVITVAPPSPPIIIIHYILPSPNSAVLKEGGHTVPVCFNCSNAETIFGFCSLLFW